VMVLRSGLNDDKWHHVVVVVDERSLRLSADVDHVQSKSAVLRRCSAAPQIDGHRDHTRPVLISLAGIVTHWNWFNIRVLLR